MSDINYYAIDLETNGLAVRMHEICELSIIRGKDKAQLSRMVKVDFPENSSYDALKITGKSIHDLRRGISKEQLINDVEKFISEDGLTPAYRCLVGHNIINFDKRFLWHLWEKYDKTFPFDLYLDTIHLTREYAKVNGIVKPKTNLQAACDMLEIKKSAAGMHNALADTRNCFLLWQKLMGCVDYLKHIKNLPHALTEPDFSPEDLDELS